MATYVNNLRLKEITTGDEDGTWGTSTNTNLELITDGFSYGTKGLLLTLTKPSPCLILQQMPRARCTLNYFGSIANSNS
jgi:hypothetical protein